MMMKPHLVACVASLAAWAPAQGPAFVLHRPPVIEFYATNVPGILEQWPQTKLGRLFTDEDARSAGQRGAEQTAQAIAAKLALYRATLQLDPSGTGNLEPDLVSRLYRMEEFTLFRLLEKPIEEVQSVELTISADPELGTRSYPRVLRTMTCRPRYEGRWTQAFDEEVRQWRESAFVEAVADAKVDGFPADVFRAPAEAVAASRMNASQQWMLHLPGRFISGCGVPEEMGTVDAGPPRPDGEVGFSIAFAALMEREIRGQEIPMFDLRKLQKLSWRAGFVGDLLQTVLRVDYDGAPKGLVGALLRGEAPLPAQSLPGQPLAQLRCSVDLPELLQVLAESDQEFALPAPLRDLLEAACTGGVAIGCCAPPPGGLIPRLYVTADLADAASLQQLLDTVLPEGTPVKKRRFGELEATTLLIPDMVQALQPTYCIADGQLILAESPLSMRALLKARGGAPAMDVDGALAPTGEGDVLPSGDLRFDAAAIYENFYERWLPLFALANGRNQAPLLQRDDLPEPDVVAEHLGKGRGVLRREGDAVSLVQASASGGLELTAMLFAWPTMLADEALRLSYSEVRFKKALTVQRLSAIGEALDRFEQHQGRRPRDLAELFVAQKLPDDALLIPGDSFAEEVALLDGRKIRSSFRYYPTPLDLAELGAGMVPPDGGGLHQGSTRAMLLEIQPGKIRMALMEDGTTPVVSGPPSQVPIGQFGAEKKR